MFLKKIRLEKGLSQRELAETLGYKSGQFVSNYERDMCPVPEKVLKVLTAICPKDGLIKAIQEERTLRTKEMIERIYG